MAGGPIIYRCKPQQCVSLSSTKSKLYAAGEAGKSICYLRTVLNHLGVKLTKPTPLHVDNQATISITNSNKATRRLRHVDLRYFAIL